jgi:ABC-2 type transport system permease protein
MRSVFVICWKDLKQRLRDRSAVVMAFVVPLGIAFIISSAFGGGFVDTFEATYGVVDLDRSPVSRAFEAEVLKAPQLREQVTVRRLRSVAEARGLVADDDLSAAFVIPKGFGGAVTGNRRATMEVLRNPEAPIGSDVATALADAYTTQINAGRLAVATTLRAQRQPPDPERVAALAASAARERVPVRLVDGEVGVRKVSGVNYFGPAMAVFSLFFTTSFVGRSLIAERQGGTLPRILAAPIRKHAIVLGKSASAFVLGIVSFVVMFVLFGLLLDVQWGDPLALVVLTVVTVLAVMGVMTLVQTGARTQESADAVAQVATVSFALLGGSFFPLFQMPEMMQRLSYITPNGWALRGYTDIAYDGATLGDLGPHLIAIGAFAVVTLSLGMWRSRRLA